MKKRWVLFLTILLCACTSTSYPHIQLEKKVTLSLFYVQTCPQCHEIEDNVIPMLKEVFKDQIVIHQYDLDDEHIVDVYDPIIDSLVDFDEEFYGNGPFIVLEGYFAVLGYTEGDEEFLIEDIQKAVKDEQLGYELEGRRFLYKQ